MTSRAFIAAALLWSGIAATLLAGSLTVPDTAPATSERDRG